MTSNFNIFQQMEIYFDKTNFELNFIRSESKEYCFILKTINNI